MQSYPPSPELNHDEYWMHLALSLATEAEKRGDVPVGCVIVNDSGLVATGFNERENEINPCAHAELLAIQRAAARLGRWRLFDCTLYVTLEPCFMCAGSIVLARIPRVIFAATDPKTGAVCSLASLLQDSRLNHQCEVKSGVLAEEASAQLRLFFKKRRG